MCVACILCMCECSYSLILLPWSRGKFQASWANWPNIHKCPQIHTYTHARGWMCLCAFACRFNTFPWHGIVVTCETKTSICHFLLFFVSDLSERMLECLYLHVIRADYHQLGSLRIRCVIGMMHKVLYVTRL